MAMRLALNQWSLWKELRGRQISVDAFIEGAVERGFEAVELLDFEFDTSPENVAGTRELCDRHGVEVCVFGIRNDFATRDFGEQIEQGNRLKAGLRTADALGAKVMRIFAGRLAEGIDFDNAEARMIEALHMALDWAAPLGIRLALENFGQLCGHTDQILEILRVIGNPALGVTADLGNFLLVDERPADSIVRLRNHIHHVHLTDFALVDQPADEESILTSSAGLRYIGTTLGDGVAQVDEVLGTLETIGHSGFASLEYQGPLPGWEGVDASLPALRGHFQPKV